jgi:hypothetical protein
MTYGNISEIQTMTYGSNSGEHHIVLLYDSNSEIQIIIYGSNSGIQIMNDLL